MTNESKKFIKSIIDKNPQETIEYLELIEDNNQELDLENLINISNSIKKFKNLNIDRKEKISENLIENLNKIKNNIEITHKLELEHLGYTKEEIGLLYSKKDNENIKISLIENLLKKMGFKKWIK